MDPASILGIVTGVVGLVPLCAGGFDFIAGICKAHEGAQEHMIRIQMQRGVDSLSGTWYRRILTSP